ncbi:MAG: zinc dependent phospholipase C family protein [Planctomycetes bacterium]|nr:zinc dependent phospholipase C family protein [Planctomycetota bacterium]
MPLPHPEELSGCALFLAGCAATLLWPLATAAWGPGLHIRMATRLLAGMKDRLPPEYQDLLSRYTHDFLYGNIAADIINFKRFGGLKNHCHNWNIKERFEGMIAREHERAFLYGYLCHLSADVVAHNHFVPYHLLYALPPRLLGHTYWEARADGVASADQWEKIDELRTLKALHESDQLIEAAVRRKALSLASNKWIFNHILLARSRKSWREVMEKMRTRAPRGTIREPHFAECIAAAEENMHRVFDDKGLATLRSLDPNGQLALKKAMRMRRDLVARHGSREAGAEEACELAERHYAVETSQ